MAAIRPVSNALKAHPETKTEVSLQSFLLLSSLVYLALQIVDISTVVFPIPE